MVVIQMLGVLRLARQHLLSLAMTLAVVLVLAFSHAGAAQLREPAASPLHGVATDKAGGTSLTWANAGSGGWGNAVNWSPVQVPASCDAVTVANGGTARLVTSTGAAADTTVGPVGGTGTLEVTNSTFDVFGALQLAYGSGSVGDATGTLEITDSTTNVTGAFSLSVVDGVPSSGSGVLAASATISGGSFEVAGDLEMLEYAINGTASVTGTASLTVSGLTRFAVVGDFDIADYGNAGGTSSGSATLVVDDVADFRAREFEFGSYEGDSLQPVSVSVDATITDTTMVLLEDIELAEITGDALARVTETVSLTLERTALDLGQGFLVGLIDAPFLDAASAVDATLILRDSRATASEIAVGILLDPSPGSVRGRLELERSFIEISDSLVWPYIGELYLFPDSELVFHIEGTTRASAANVAGPNGVPGTGLYSAIDFQDAPFLLLGGTLELVINDTGVQVGDTYDLIRNIGTPGFIEGFTEDFTEVIISGLCRGVEVAVAPATDVDSNVVLRATVTAAPMPCEIFSDDFELGNLDSWTIFP